MSRRVSARPRTPPDSLFPPPSPRRPTVMALRTLPPWTTAGVLLAVCLSPTLADARDDAPALPQKVTTIEGVTEYRLDNGLRILLYPDPSTPKVSVICTVLVGSRHEGYGDTGVAHLVEHMNF